MSGRLTLFGAGEILTAYFSRSAVPPTSLYLALIVNNAPSSYVNGSELDEPTAAGYARAEIPNTLDWWSNDGMTNIVTTAQDVVFVTAAEDWGTIRYWALLNDLVGGDPILVGQMESPFAVSAGDTAVVPAATLDVELGPFFSSWET